MKQLMINMLHTLAYLAICGLMGYYNFQLSGWVGIATNILYLVIGIMLAETWLKVKNKSEPILDNLSLSEIDTAVPSASDPEKTAKEEMGITDFTLTSPN